MGQYESTNVKKTKNSTIMEFELTERHPHEKPPKNLTLILSSEHASIAFGDKTSSSKSSGGKASSGKSSSKKSEEKVEEVSE